MGGETNQRDKYTFAPVVDSDESSSSQGTNISNSKKSSQEFISPPQKKPALSTPFNVYGVKSFDNTIEAMERTGIPPRQMAYVLNSFYADVDPKNKEKL